MKTNFSAGTAPEGSTYSQQYQQFPSQHARIPTSLSNVQGDMHGSGQGK